LQEAISRYEQYAKEHTIFNDDHSAFLEWLSQVEEELKELCQIVGDLAVLQVHLYLRKLVKKGTTYKHSTVTAHDTLILPIILKNAQGGRGIL
jgi:hypothetical protein